MNIKGFGFPNPSQNEATIVFFLQTAIFEKSCSRLGEIAIFQVLGCWKPEPNPYEIVSENVVFFNIDFFGFRLRFRRVVGLQDGAKSAALLAAPGVLNPTAFFCARNILAWSY